MAAARLEPRLPEVISIPALTAGDLDSLLNEEIGVWQKRFNWDFRPSADLLRRFIHIRALYGKALVLEKEIIGYAYHVCEGRKGLIGDFYVRSDSASAAYEFMLLEATVHGLMNIPGIRRIESQLMLLNLPNGMPLPFGQHLSRHERYFMEIGREAIVPLKPKVPGLSVKFSLWAERYQEDIAHLVSAAYRGHVDSEINDQYRTIPGARHFLMNIVKFPGCGAFAPGASVVALDERTGRVCGVCLASMVSANAGHVTQLCILPGIRGSSLGYELLRQALVNLVNHGCASVSLTVTSSNVDAIRLYKSVGFESSSQFPALVWDGF